MWEYDMEYAEARAKDYDICIVKRPSVPSPERRVSKIEIPGRDGALYTDEELVEDIEISVEMNFIGKHNEWFERWRNAKKWLLQKGQHRLKFGDDTEHFYLVKKANLSEAERLCNEIGKFTVIFTCNGYQYLESGKKTYGRESVLYNPYSIAHPLYTIKGEGVCALTINGKAVHANVGQNLSIDTELMLAYRKDGTIANTSIKGDYKDLYLYPGNNTIEITNGFSLDIIPRWRCL